MKQLFTGVIFPMLVLLIYLLNGCSGGNNGDNNDLQYPEKDYVYSEKDPEAISVENLFYVAKNGNDTNPGTESQPWLTIQKAADTLNPGQKVYIKEGIYHERVVVTKSGSTGNYIIFSAYPNSKVILDGSDIAPVSSANWCWGGLFYIKNANYIIIKGFEIRNTSTTGIFAENADKIIIKNNYTYNTFASGIGTWFSTNVTIDGNEVVWACHPKVRDSTQGTQECISVAGCTYFEVKNNHVHHNGTPYNGGEGIDAKHSVNGTVHHNLVNDLGRLGIYIDAWDVNEHDIEVFDNVVYRCMNDGISCAAENGGTLENIKVYNNVIYDNGTTGISIASWGIGTHHYFKNIYIYNNTIYNNQYCKWQAGGGIHVNAPEGENIYIRNNICYKNNTNTVFVEKAPSNLVIESNLEGVDPLFINPDNNDFHLRRGSPAIDNATSASVPAKDFDDSLRPNGSGHDIGAFEFY